MTLLAERPTRRSPPMLEAVLLGMLALALLGGRLGVLHRPRVQTWATVFVSLIVQALPFLVLGTAVSALLAAFVPASALQRALPRRPGLAVPVAGAAGFLLPGCECGSVPIAGNLVARGVPAGPALAFLLSAPAINPVVLVSTAVAFPGQPRVVLARLLASLLTAITVGLLWTRRGAGGLRPPRIHVEPGAGRLAVLRVTLRHDFLQAGGFLVIGGLTAATLNVTVPTSVLDSVARPVVGVLALSVLAVVLAICSEADAFVAATLTQFSLTARLAFLVVGPTVDIKLIALQAGTFGRRFAVRFAPTTFVVAILASGLVAAAVL